MRALFDANVLISASLPAPTGNRTIDVILRAATGGKFALLVPDEALLELANKVATKPYLAARIAPDHFRQFTPLLTKTCTTWKRQTGRSALSPWRSSSPSSEKMTC